MEVAHAMAEMVKNEELHCDFVVGVPYGAMILGAVNKIKELLHHSAGFRLEPCSFRNSDCFIKLQGFHSKTLLEYTAIMKYQVTGFPLHLKLLVTLNN